MKHMNFWLILTLLIPIAAEGLGFWHIHSYILFYFIALPWFLYFVLSLAKKPFQIPIRISIAYILFLISSKATSLFFSLDKQSSFELTLFYGSVYLFFLLAYNNREQVTKHMGTILMILGVVFSSWSIALSILKNRVPALVPLQEYQFVFPFSFTHNHLGDFIGLAMLVLVVTYLHSRRRQLLITLGVFFPFLLFSYSRSGYVSVLITTIVALCAFGKQNLKLKLLLAAAMLAITSAFFLLVSYTGQGQSSYGRFLELIRLSPRNIAKTRLEYLRQGMTSFSIHPWLGIGPGNFSLASKHAMTNSQEVTSSAHNIFLEVLVGNGILGLLPFVAIILLLIWKGTQKTHSLPFFVFLYLLINFQTDYTYQIYGFLVLFAVAAGAFYEEADNVRGLFIYGALSCVLFIAAAVIVASNVCLLYGRTMESIRLYPLNKAAYWKATDIAAPAGEGTYPASYPLLLREYEQIAPSDPYFLIRSVEYYRAAGKRKRALVYYRRMYEANRFIPLPYIEQLYVLTRDTESTGAANLFLNGVINTYVHMPRYTINERFRSEFVDMCTRLNLYSCSRLGW